MIKDRSWLFGLVGRLMLYVFPAAGVLGALALIALKQYEYFILSIYLILPLIGMPFLYLIVRGRTEKDMAGGSDYFKLLVAGYLLMFAFSITQLYAFDPRTYIYYIAVAAMATIVFVEIVRSKITRGRSAVILLQISLLVLNLCWGITLKYFMYIGRTDILVHSYYAESLVQLGHVTSIFYDYQPFPLWHIVSAGIYLVGGPEFPMEKVMAIAGGLAFATLPIVAYLIAMRIFKDERIALVAALFMAFFPDLVSMGTSTISREIAEILMVFVIYLLLASKSKVKYLLIVPITVAIIIYHSISILFVALILTVLYVLQMLFVKKEERFVSIWLVLFSLAATGTYWVLNANIIIQRIIGNGNAAASTNTITVPRALAENVPWNELFNYLQYLPAMAFIFVGAILLFLGKRYGNRARILGLAALGFVWVSFPGPVDALGSIATNLGLDRFSEYTFIILVLIAAVGIAGLYYRSGRRGRAALVAIFALWVLLSVSSDWVASDNPLVKRPFYTFDFSQQEITGMDQLVAHTTGVLMSDYVPNRYYESSPYVDNTTILEVDASNMTFLRNGPQDVLLIRAGEQAKRELRTATLVDNVFVPKPEVDQFTYVSKNEPVWATLAGYNRIYDSQAIQAYN